MLQCKITTEYIIPVYDKLKIYTVFHYYIHKLK